MNTELILKLVKPYLKNNAISFSDFKNLFLFLSRKELYIVVDVLIEHHIDFIHDDGTKYDYVSDSRNQDDLDDEIIEIDDSLDSSDDEFEILYDEDIFKDRNSAEQKKDDVFYYKNIKQSNEILCRLIQEGNQQAKQDICVKNKRLVDKYAGAYEKYYGNHMSFDDIEQAGMIGLIKAAEKFNINKGYLFSTYAVFWIRQAIVREIYDNGFAIRVPVHMMERINKVTKLDNFLAEKEMDYEERMQAISDELGIPIEFIEYCLMVRQNYLSYASLNTPIGEEQDVEIQDMVDDEEAVSVEDMVAASILHDILAEVLSILTEREQKVLNLRFGLEDGRTHTLEEIGKEFNVTRERIRQIEAKALRKLRHPSRLKKLKDFL